MQREDIVWTYSGVRPLYDDGASKAQEATRDYVLKADSRTGGAPIVNIFGGKITTYRRLAESHAGEDRGPARRARASRGRPRRALPGGDFPATGFDAEVDRLKSAYPFLDIGSRAGWSGSTARRRAALLGLARSHADLGRHFGADLYEAEVRYLIEHEWAVDRRGCAVAAHQARPAVQPRGGGRAR